MMCGAHKAAVLQFAFLVVGRPFKVDNEHRAIFTVDLERSTYNSKTWSTKTRLTALAIATGQTG